MQNHPQQNTNKKSIDSRNINNNNNNKKRQLSLASTVANKGSNKTINIKRRKKAAKK